MNKSLLSGVAATVAGLTLLAAPLAWAMSAQDALRLMGEQGYVAPHDVEKQYGYWTAKAVGNDGQRVRLLVKDDDGALTAIRKADLGTRLPGADQVRQTLQGMGYGHIEDIEFDDGFWEAEVRRDRRSEKVEVILHPVTLAVLSQTGQAGGGRVLAADQVRQALQRSGYTGIHDLAYDDGRWEADAVNAAGQRVELAINAQTGAVEREKLDD